MGGGLETDGKVEGLKEGKNRYEKNGTLEEAFPSEI